MENKGADVACDPPKYISSDVIFDNKHKPLSCSWLFWLLFYSGAVTAALIVLAVVGSLHVNKIEQYCNKDYTKILHGDETTTMSGSAVTLTEYLNVEANKQMVKDSNGSITVLDYNKGVIGYYNKPDDKCYLIGGVNSNLASPKEVAEYVDVKKSKLEPVSDKPEEVEYTFGEVVKDGSWLPAEVQEVCIGKETRWLNRNDTVQSVTSNEVAREIARQDHSSVNGLGLTISFKPSYYFPGSKVYVRLRHG
ncbi:hypothetical protein LSH36_597g01024 [Paralvinella palmiformis]|uniref:BRICHOS domain-containing protein n=1 Tax=Paralvinella palmiformis TaxID=53620 RepID=A0AAD9MV46_9ANNE|nr:hypothetical protein LSH36_597g01024 [Paralvinella palmiformis]